MSEKDAFIYRRQKEEEEKRIRSKLEKAYEEEKAKVRSVKVEFYLVCHKQEVQ